MTLNAGKGSQRMEEEKTLQYHAPLTARREWEEAIGSLQVQGIRTLTGASPVGCWRIWTPATATCVVVLCERNSQRACRTGNKN
jgi:hypothetical protein